ncbi:thioredoxin-like protein, partial [Aureobasidium sp. EXF-10728]
IHRGHFIKVQFNIKIYSDTCYIGLKTLEQAIKLYQRTYPNGSQDTFHITWSPYYLDAQAPTPGIPAATRIIQKNGIDRAQGIKLRLQRIGKAHGIDFSFNGKVGNTRDSHRVLYLAGLNKGEDVQMGLAKELFSAHFEGDADVSCVAELTRAGVAAGIGEEEVVGWLESDDGGEEVDQEAKRAREKGVTSVPTFEVNGRKLEGAEDALVFYEVFTEIKTCERLAD